MSLHVALLDPESPSWSKALEGAEHDFYHFPAYVELCAEMERGKARALLIEDGDERMLLPLVERVIPGEDLDDATSPYGYPSPIFTCSTDRAALLLQRTWPRAVEFLRGQRIVSLFVRLHPLLEAPLAAMGQTGALVEHGETVSIDLRLSDEEAWAQMRSTSRKEIRRAERAGHRAYTDDGWEHLHAFVRLYQSTMTRVGALDYYMLPESHFLGLRRALDGHLHLWVVDVEGTIAAAALIATVGRLVQYHLSASDPAFSKHQPTKLLLEGVRRWARARGHLDFHLGGGVGSAEDSLFFFKAGLSRRRHRFRTWRLVIDDAAYSALCRTSLPSVDRSQHKSFFPAYRER